MAPKRYQTRTIQEAIGKIKKEMGPDAIILSTRRIAGSGQSRNDHGLFEVTAAPKDCPPAITRFPSMESLEKSTGVMGDGGDDAFLFRASQQHGTIREELFQIKDMLFLLNQAGGWPDVFRNYPELLEFYAGLIRIGLSGERAQWFIQRVVRTDAAQELSAGEIRKRVLSDIARTIITADPFQTNSSSREDDGRKIVSFIGPTGVGKTTTIAKLAADLSLKRKQKVGLVSIDSYRIGAIEQLKTYAAIIGLPCMSAFNTQDVRTAARKMQNKDVILIDTAGQSHLDRKRLMELAHLLDCDPKISSQLVISATTRRPDMKTAVERFAVLKPKTYIFTKLDETGQRGGIIDQLLDFRMPISYVTNGQNVPEDILPASRQNVSRLIFNRM
ncbi:MAG: flagellar biosynthesis protein FlhF [Thermodesulfobacteriota bacterium]